VERNLKTQDAANRWERPSMANLERKIGSKMLIYSYVNCAFFANFSFNLGS
jgi:hypothetical protein